MTDIWIYVMSCVWLAGAPPGCLCCKNLNVGHYMQTFQPNFVISAMLKGTTDFYHFIPLSLTLTVAGDYKVSTNENILASFSHRLFN